MARTKQTARKLAGLKDPKKSLVSKAARKVVPLKKTANSSAKKDSAHLKKLAGLLLPPAIADIKPVIELFVKNARKNIKDEIDTLYDTDTDVIYAVKTGLFSTVRELIPGYIDINDEDISQYIDDEEEIDVVVRDLANIYETVKPPYPVKVKTAEGFIGDIVNIEAKAGITELNDLIMSIDNLEKELKTAKKIKEIKEKKDLSQRISFLRRTVLEGELNRELSRLREEGYAPSIPDDHDQLKVLAEKYGLTKELSEKIRKVGKEIEKQKKKPVKKPKKILGYTAQLGDGVKDVLLIQTSDGYQAIMIDTLATAEISFDKLTRPKEAIDVYKRYYLELSEKEIARIISDLRKLVNRKSTTYSLRNSKFSSSSTKLLRDILYRYT